ncbi:hypothetical protein J437_LFUL004522 [Ladona fulva]|uniref:Uncharacterized protein n=1 Tax=Ladona fulva TaxID=123851 RepID=A0A8K0KBC3_LADFU|nr:hypothetical protein J437_LFUL004522 [Ladona fulva]
MDDKPTPTVVNQQQEVEVRESRLPEQQLKTKIQDHNQRWRLIHRGNNSVRSGCQLIKQKPHPTQMRMFRSLNPH